MKIRISNTARGTVSKRTQEFITERDSNGKVNYTNSVRITFVEPKSTFECPLTIEQARMLKFQEAKASLKLAEGVDYRLDSESITEFDATEEMPKAVSATYRPMAQLLSW